MVCCKVTKIEDVVVSVSQMVMKNEPNIERVHQPYLLLSTRKNSSIRKLIKISTYKHKIIIVREMSFKFGFQISNG